MDLVLLEELTEIKIDDKINELLDIENVESEEKEGDD